MGMTPTNITRPHGLVSLGLEALPIGSVVETRHVGGWRLYVYRPEAPHLDDTVLDWVVLATSSDTGSRWGMDDRRVPTEVVAAAALDAELVTVLEREQEEQGQAEDPTAGETRRERLEAVLDEHLCKINGGRVRTSTLVAVANAVEGVL